MCQASGIGAAAWVHLFLSQGSLVWIASARFLTACRWRQMARACFENLCSHTIESVGTAQWPMQADLEKALRSVCSDLCMLFCKGCWHGDDCAQAVVVETDTEDETTSIQMVMQNAHVEHSTRLAFQSIHAIAFKQTQHLAGGTHAHNLQLVGSWSACCVW